VADYWVTLVLYLLVVAASLAVVLLIGRLYVSQYFGDDKD
jgi:hypothetical protein